MLVHARRQAVRKTPGFDGIIGNPPWEGFKHIRKEFAANFYRGKPQFSKKGMDGQTFEKWFEEKNSKRSQLLPLAGTSTKNTMNATRNSLAKPTRSRERAIGIYSSYLLSVTSRLSAKADNSRCLCSADYKPTKVALISADGSSPNTGWMN